VTVFWQTPPQRRINYEAIWLIVSIGSLGVSVAWFASGLPWPRCAFHDLTGLPCLTCGATRATVEFLHGHFLPALGWNPLVFVILCGLVVFNLYAAAVLLVHAPRIRIARLTTFEKRSATIVVIAAVALNWIYLLSHWRDF
jgi:hypothetical protein